MSNTPDVPATEAADNAEPQPRSDQAVQDARRQAQALEHRTGDGPDDASGEDAQVGDDA